MFGHQVSGRSPLHCDGTIAAIGLVARGLLLGLARLALDEALDAHPLVELPGARHGEVRAATVAAWLGFGFGFGFGSGLGLGLGLGLGSGLGCRSRGAAARAHARCLRSPP